MKKSDPHGHMMSDLTEIPNIGPAMAGQLLAAGVRDAADLREIGAHEAYARIIASGERPHFIPYYVLHMALQGRPWNDCKGEEKAKLRSSFDALRAAPEGGLGKLERDLREIGLLPPEA